MKREKISDAMGKINSRHIEEAATTFGKLQVKKKNNWVRWGAIAACLVVMVMAVIVVAPMIFGDDDLMPPVDDTAVGESSGLDNVLEKYYDYAINDGMFAEYIGGKVIDEDKIGDKLETVVVTAGWKNEAGEWLTTETLDAEVYAIEYVESNVAVALRFIDKGEALTTTHYYTIIHPNSEYNGMVFPNYVANNPVRYLEETEMGKCNGWQNFGLNGEIRTITVPVGSTYVYQMYSYYIRNDLRHIYSEEELPDTLEKLPEWLSDTESAGRRSFWYSMGLRIPTDITVEATTAIASENGGMEFVKAEYKVKIMDGSNEKEENWVIYFMEEDGVYSAYAVLANENFDIVKSYSESIVKSYQKKQ